MRRLSHCFFFLQLLASKLEAVDFSSLQYFFAGVVGVSAHFMTQKVQWDNKFSLNVNNLWSYNDESNFLVLV